MMRCPELIGVRGKFCGYCRWFPMLRLSCCPLSNQNTRFLFRKKSPTSGCMARAPISPAPKTCISFVSKFGPIDLTTTGKNTEGRKGEPVSLFLLLPCHITTASGSANPIYERLGSACEHQKCLRRNHRLPAPMKKKTPSGRQY